MNRILIISLLFSLTFHWSYAQVTIQNEEQLYRYNAIPQERIFTHVNTSMFLTGEYLYYKIYCLNSSSSYLSNLSKIAYVTLISDKGEQLFKQKIKLKNGLGNGDFFIPVSAQTGSYKLLVYTNWMMNKGIDHFFQEDIHIINPYQTTKTQDQFSVKDATTIPSSQIKNTSNNLNAHGPLTLVLNDQTFKTRSKVTIAFKSTDKLSLANGDYSISVRKRDQLPEPSKQSIASHFQKSGKVKKEDIPTKNTSIYIPELRGELITGNVSTTTNNNIKDLKIAASIPGENYYITIAKTDAQGNFFLNIENDYEGDRIFLEILDKPYKDYNITLKELPSLNYSKLKFKRLELDATLTNEIVQRSIHNQIENAYFKYKPDSTISIVSKQLFDTKKVQSYKLDDFTRFKTVRETIFEIVKDVSISRDGVRVQGYNFGTNSGILPLVIIDGLQITDHASILDYNASNILAINVYRDRFILGTKLYQGALLLHTKNNTIETFQNNTSLFSFNLLRPQLSKNYFTQRYDTITTSRIPDDRMQLVWIPNLKVTEKKTTIDFFTSDITGDFEICIEGFTSEQKPVSIRSYFSVKN